jgi:hypothetical protein
VGRALDHLSDAGEGRFDSIAEQHGPVPQNVGFVGKPLRFVDRGARALNQAKPVLLIHHEVNYQPRAGS